MISETATGPAPAVSVLIPVYNTAKHLSRGIFSLFTQQGIAWDDLEIIIINDASEDDAESAIRFFTDTDERVHAVHLKENRGTFAARIAGLKTARGKYILNLDADDTLDPDAVRTLLAIAEKNNADAVGFGARELNGDGSRDPYGNTLDSAPFTLHRKDIFDAVFRSHAYSWSMCLKMIRRDILLSVMEKYDMDPGFYCIFADDFLQFIPTALHLKKFIMSGRIFYNYYREIGITGSRKMTPESFRKAASMTDALRFVKEILVREGIWETYRSAFAIREREQLKMLAEKWHLRLDKNDREIALTELKQRYDAPEVIAELFTESGPENTEEKHNAVKHLFRTESWIWYFLKRLQGALRFRKGKKFYDC